MGDLRSFAKRMFVEAIKCPGFDKKTKRGQPSGKCIWDHFCKDHSLPFGNNFQEMING